MLRDLASVILDLQGGMQAAAGGARLRLAHAELTLPVDSALVLKGGGCTLLADVSRNHADAAWHEAPSRLAVTWTLLPTEDLP